MIYEVCDIVKIQRRFRFLQNELNQIKDKIVFQREYLTGMINTLLFMNTIKLYQNTNSLYDSLLNELKIIKMEMDNIPKNISLRTLRFYSTEYLKYRCNEIDYLLIKYSNHICSDSMCDVFNLFIGKDWNKLFNKTEKEILFFILKFIKPISIWDSSNHIFEINYLTSNNKNLKNKQSGITKDIIESLLNIMPKKNTNHEINSIIINQSDLNSSSSFIKTINDLIEVSPSNSLIQRVNHFNKNDCEDLLFYDNILFKKNINGTTLVEEKNGTTIYIRVNSKILVIQGLFIDDVLDISNDINFVKERYFMHKSVLSYEVLNVPKQFKNNYLKTLTLRDIIINNSNDIIDDLKKKYNDYKVLQTKHLMVLIDEFMISSKYRKIDILTLLLMSNEDDQKLAFILFDTFKSKEKKDLSTEIYNGLHHSIREILDISKNKLENDEYNLGKINDSDIPYERRINLLKADENVKVKAMEKLKSVKSSGLQGDSKSQAWLDGLLKIPFGIYSQNEIISFKESFINKIQEIDPYTKLFSDHDIDLYINKLSIHEPSNELVDEWNNYKIDKRDYLKNVRSILDNSVYGHKEAKTQIERIFAQWINGKTNGAVLGLQGPPGTGKTSLAKHGISQCLKDKSGKPRPFAFLPIGGSVNSSTLVGHNFTYVGSTWGKIADILMVSNCMNPIIFIDELDKVSQTEYGREIISILTHLTDSTQNDEFEDKFFAGVKLDLSKALIVFSFNDPNLIDPILKDRITIIETHPLNINEKIVIVRDYMMPEICGEVGFNKDEIILDDNIIKYLIETYTNEAGVRKIKEKIVEIVRDINLNRFHSDEYVLPFSVTKEYIKLLFENKPRVRTKKIHFEPSIGIVNGLYATSSGIGGITLIQAVKFPADKMLDLQLTGKAGDVMKESVQYALKVAWGLLTIEQQEEIIIDSNNKKSFGIHIHCPDGSTPKDGPSAGLAFTLAIYSLLTNNKVNNKVCMTGEIDLFGNAGIIGGLESKLVGGKKAGCCTALVPKDNLEDIERMRRENLSPEDDTFNIIFVDNIQDIIKHSIVK
jgi:ATP-dependent Lon protease